MDRYFSEISASCEDALHEAEVDGVRLLTLHHRGRSWRLGGVAGDWRRELAGLSDDPSPEELSALTMRRVWLRRADQPPPLALVCCGLGAVYPGMGRELYDSFPAAREAMDRLAAKADWDLLGLMDETDVDKILLSRWQQPYLLMLEYAQFHYLQSLGLRPNIVAGHSLGELIALCIAGACTPEDGWHVLDGRSKATAMLEESARNETGMMSVHAPQSVIDECLAEYPSLFVSNYNTPTQFILSGPKEDLRTASRALRKRRIPAMQLNVSFAFHHPGMRVMREASLESLLTVPMQGARLPMLSNVTADLYPDEVEGIREYMLDLDENPVRWVECVEVMWRRYKARHFLELGPADIVSGLVGEIRPEALCIAVGRKGKEAENMRNVVARLHALGHLPGAGTFHPPSGLRKDTPQAERLLARPQAAPARDASSPAQEFVPAHVEEFMPVLMEATGFSRRELHPDMDLRYDLSLRSSRFPLIMHEVEQRFGLTLRFEDMQDVATIRDLADRVQKLRGLAEDRRGHVSPQSLESGASEEGEATLDLSRHFSHFRDLWLADARPWPDSPHACLPPSVQLAALMEGAARLLPGLTPHGAEELSFSEAQCPFGVTREGHARCRSLRERPDGPQCQAELRLRDILPNGRARRTCSSISSARIQLTPDLAKTPAPAMPDPVRAPASAAPGGREELRNFYERHTGLGPSFHLLTELYVPEEKRLLAHMRVPTDTLLVGTEDSERIFPLEAFEAAAQAALALALKRNAWQNGNSRMTLSQVTAVYFSRNCIPGEALELEVRDKLDESRVVHCDAEVRDLRGHVVLALRGMRLCEQ